MAEEYSVSGASLPTAQQRANPWLILAIIAIVLLLCCCILAIVVFVLLTPTTGTVFSNIIENLPTTVP